MKVSTVQLVIGATIIEPFESDTLDLDAIYGERRIPSGEVGGLDAFSPLFSVPTFLANGKQTAQLLVHSNQKVWGTEVFEVDFDRADIWIGPITEANLKEREWLPDGAQPRPVR